MRGPSPSPIEPRHRLSSSAKSVSLSLSLSFFSLFLSVIWLHFNLSVWFLVPQLGPKKKPYVRKASFINSLKLRGLIPVHLCFCWFMILALIFFHLPISLDGLVSFFIIYVYAYRSRLLNLGGIFLFALNLGHDSWIWMSSRSWKRFYSEFELVLVKWGVMLIIWPQFTLFEKGMTKSWATCSNCAACTGSMVMVHFDIRFLGSC